jgi:hypothetical protein
MSQASFQQPQCQETSMGLCETLGVFTTVRTSLLFELLLALTFHWCVYFPHCAEVHPPLSISHPSYCPVCLASLSYWPIHTSLGNRVANDECKAPLARLDPGRFDKCNAGTCYESTSSPLERSLPLLQKMFVPAIKYVLASRIHHLHCNIHPGLQPTPCPSPPFVTS